MRNNLRRLLAALLFAAAAFETTTASAALKVFACEPEWAALLKELGGTDVETYSATTGQQDPHQIQARPSLLAQYRKADMAVCTGAELEIGWMPVLQQRAGNPNVQPGKPTYFEAADYVQKLEVPTTLDRAQGDVHAQGNPHIQTDPRNIALVADALGARLAQLDPEHAAAYRKRTADFAARWTSAILRWQKKAEPLKGQSVISHHKTWVYVYNWLGLQEVATLEPKPGIPPTAAHLDEVLTGLKYHPASMVIHAAYEDAHASEWMSEHAHIPAVELPYTVGGVAGTDDLFGLFNVTIDRLVAAAGHAADKRATP